MNQQIAAKLADLERRVESHDVEIQELIDVIRELMVPPPANNRRIGFEIPSSSAKSHSRALKVHTMRPPNCR
jgi:hypothetical protein